MGLPRWVRSKPLAGAASAELAGDWPGSRPPVASQRRFAYRSRQATADQHRSEDDAREEGHDSKAGSNQMWGGRFAEGPAAIMREINASIPSTRPCGAGYRRRKAHVAMLGAQGIVSAEDAAAIAQGLDKVAANMK
jgi:hypothetical protein